MSISVQHEADLQPGNHDSSANPDHNVPGGFDEYGVLRERVGGPTLGGRLEHEWRHELVETHSLWRGMWSADGIEEDEYHGSNNSLGETMCDV